MIIKERKHHEVNEERCLDFLMGGIVAMDREYKGFNGTSSFQTRAYSLLPYLNLTQKG